MIAGARWSLCRGGPQDGDAAPGDESEWMAIEGPATVAGALRACGRWSLDAPRHDFDEHAWWFRARFDAPPDADTLGLDGVATCATAWLNGHQLVSGTNMFVAHRCDVSGILRTRDNELLIRCDPLNAALKARRPRPRWRTPMVANQQLRWWRTTLLGRTPGWSPAAAPVGPWRDVWLGSSRQLTPRDVRIDAQLGGRDGIVRCEVARALDRAVELVLSREGRKWRAPIGTPLTIENVTLWNAHTHGEPALYEAVLVVEGKGEVALPPVGFRSIAVDRSGDGFRVVLNGEPVFCRGAVWMPLDPVTLRATEQQYADAIAQVRACGMNMLRVAGAAVYEEDAFYEACDRAGVLVWQDFMFANMDYPDHDEAFAESVRTEAQQQLARWGSHPCIAVLCGNSEAEQQAAMWGAPRNVWEGPLFHDVLPRLCREFAPGVPYWPSSAHGGALPQQPDAGTTSYYGVGAYLRPIEDARRSHLKFATECLAFANVPSPATIARMPGGESLRPHHPAWKDRTPRDLGAGWDFEDVRDHYLQLLFDVDANELRRTDPSRYLALGRMASAETMAAAFSEWRRPASGCGGALVLMLRDLVAGAGWGLLDDQGGPKACWHALARVLQPIALLVTDEGLNGLHLHVVNESALQLQAQLQLRAWQGGEVLVADASCMVELAARESKTFQAAALLDHFMDLAWSYRFGPPPCDAIACTLRDRDGRTLASAHHFPDRRLLANRRDIGLQARVIRHDSFGSQVAVSTRAFAYGVHFDVPGMTADDDYFHLAPGAQAHVFLRGATTSRPLGWVDAVNAARPVRIDEAAA